MTERAQATSADRGVGCSPGLLGRLLYAPQRNAKLALVVDHLRTVPDPDRGWGLAALTGGLQLRHARPALLRELLAARTDPVLFAWSCDLVGDLAETTALLWPEPEGAPAWPRLGEVVEALDAAPGTRLPELIAGWLDRLDVTGRWALLKLVTGGLRVGASARLARLALAAHGRVEPAEVEELWHGLAPPYRDLLAWLDGRAPRPTPGAGPVFRPLMLAHPLEAADLAAVGAAPEAWLAEWKWDGIRVQIASHGGAARLYSRGGDDISATFPEVIEAVGFAGVLDGELLIGRDGEVRGFDELQQRLNRKAPGASHRRDFPAFVRLYDILLDGGEDLRPLPFALRRARLEAFLARHRPARMDLSPLLAFTGLAELEALRRAAHAAAEGVMLKRRDSSYRAGRVKGLWWKWKRDPRRLDCVLMYAQRGHGRRSGSYSDCTFGCWRDGPAGPELVPVGKAYFGFTDAELAELDRWVRDHTVARYGPVREVEPRLGSRSPATRRSARPARSRARRCASRASPRSAGTSRRPRPTGSRRSCG